MHPICLTIVALTLLGLMASRAGAGDADGFADAFDPAPAALSDTGRNDFVILEPEFQLVYESKEGKGAKLITTVLPKTERIAGVEARVVESVEIAGDLPRRVTRRFLAIDRATGDVYCFGRTVDRYDGWHADGNSGTWRAGDAGARVGLVMPGKPQLGQKFYQTVAPKVAMERVEVGALAETVRVPAKRFDSCLKTIETTPTNAKRKTERPYAPGVGLLVDGAFQLVRYGRNVEPIPDPAKMIERAKARAKAAGERVDPRVPHDVARAALAGVGADPDAEQVWIAAINDPAMTPKQRANLIEDLNEDGFENPANVQPDELPLVLNRLALIEELAADAMDDVNADAFAEAYKDLANIADKLMR